MPAPHVKLAESLTALQALQKSGRRVFQSSELSRVHRERLLANGFRSGGHERLADLLQPERARRATARPGTRPSGNSARATATTASARTWHLSPEQSLLLHAENTVIPTQVVVYSPKGTNHNVDLLFGTSLYDLKQSEMPAAADLTVRDGLRLFSPPAALVRVPESFFARNPIETQVVLASLARCIGPAAAPSGRRPLRQGGPCSPARSGASAGPRLPTRSSRR